MLRTAKAALLVIATCLLWMAPRLAAAASCAESQRFTADIISLGERAGASWNDLEARRFARDARPAAVDAANEAKSCGCTATLSIYEEIALVANYADRAQNITAARQY